MSKKKMYYIGLDQGTTGTTTLLLDEQWNVIARGYKEHKQDYRNRAGSSTIRWSCGSECWNP